MAVGLRRLLTTLSVLAFAVMFGSGPVAPRSILVVFRRLVVRVLGQLVLLRSSGSAVSEQERLRQSGTEGPARCLSVP
jgi:hypothetical protein